MSARVAYLVRHGSTELNVAGCLRGHADPPLDSVGHTEADRLAKQFVGVRIGSIFTSPLLRARMTADAIAVTTGVQPQLVFRFADRDYGPWNGARRVDVERDFGHIDTAPGVERRERFARRVLGAFAAKAEQTTLPFVVVAHEAVNQLLLACLTEAADDPDRIPQRTGCWNQLTRGDRNWTATIVDAVPGGASCHEE